MPRSAAAATARLIWAPRGSTSMVTGYSIYVRNAGATYGSTPIWTGNPTPTADGSMTMNVTFTPAPSGVNYFTVVARTASSESGIADERGLGTPNPCRHDHCTSKTGCDFSAVPDGFSCDDASFCNGPEICVGGACDTSASQNCDDGIACSADACDDAAGRCTHSSPPGCCLACDSNDPCLADACAQGDCAAAEGAELEVNRVKLMNKAAGVKLAAKGRFDADPSIDPSATGAVLELRSTDGVVLYSAAIEGNLFKVGASGGRFRFAVPRVQAAYLSNGVERLDFLVKGSSWRVTVRAATPLLMDALEETPLTWMLRLGSASCARRLDMECKQKTTLSICR